MAEFLTVVVGTSFRGAVAIETVARLRRGHALRLVRDPDNKFDRNAIEVHYGGLRIGFIPRVVNPRIAPLMDRGEQLEAVVEAPAQIVAGKIKIEPKIIVTQKASAA